MMVTVLGLVAVMEAMMLLVMAYYLRQAHRRIPPSPPDLSRVSCVLLDPRGNVESVRTMVGPAPLHIRRPNMTYTLIASEGHRFVYQR